ncbi:MAG: hypothetical protein VW103_03620, partial [Halieaceae bacterium]
AAPVRKSTLNRPFISPILAGVLVLLLDAHWPDLIIGALIVFVVLRGGISILADAKRERSFEAQR